MKKSTQKAFTLAEIMIVLTVIGILTAIILPSARNLMPDKNLMKFKKAHNTLLTAITELVNSDKYYLNGDLGMRYDGVEVADTDETRLYFCQTLADTLNAKKIECNNVVRGEHNVLAVFSNGAVGFYDDYTPLEVTEATLLAAKEKLDNLCLTHQALSQNHKEIILDNNVSFYGIISGTFGSGSVWNKDGVISGTTRKRWYSPPNQFPANYADASGFDAAYKVWCMELDEFNSGEDPFGYGIRADGKIMTGLRTDQWLQKEVSN